MHSHAQYPGFMDHERSASPGKMPPLEPLQPLEPIDVPRPREPVQLADSFVTGADLHQSMNDALRLAARATRNIGTKGEPDERCRKALDVACELARRDELRIEQLLVLLKDTWRHLPEVQSAARLDADVTLSSVITHCIREFYRPSRRT